MLYGCAERTKMIGIDVFTAAGRAFAVQRRLDTDDDLHRQYLATVIDGR